MEEDIRDVIQRKLWTVEQILPQVQELIGDANELPEEAKKSIPLFPSDWSEDNVKKYVDKFRTAVRDPIRYKNRKLLEDIGVQTKGLSEEILDDSLRIKEIVRLFGELKGISERLTRVLINKEVLLAWLKVGIDTAEGKLKSILEAKTAFQRISESTVDEDLRNELIQRSAENMEFIGYAEDIISKVRFISEFGISIQYSEKFDEFQIILVNVYDELTKLQELYGIQRGEISELVKGKSVAESHDLLKKKMEDCFQQKSRLLEEWKIYSATLKSIGCDVSEAPSGLHELENEIEKLKAECLNRLGKEGLGLLKFLKGEEKFPEKISKEDIMKTLVILRPLFSKFLKEEG